MLKNALKRKPKRETRGRPQKPNTVLDRTDLEMSWFGDVFLGIG